MAIYTILAFFTVSGEMAHAPQIFDSRQQCSDAMTELIYKQTMRDVDMFCIPTQYISVSIKPHYRPW